jgi:mitochondrial import receptor subunit TOM40
MLQYEALSRDWKQISTQDNFDGFRLETQKTISKNLLTSHIVQLGSSMAPYIYQFGPTYQSANSLMLARIGLEKDLMAHLERKITPNLTAKLNLQGDLNKVSKTVYDIGLEHTSSHLALAGKAIYSGSWIYQANVTRRVSPNIQAGVDLTYLTALKLSFAQAGMRWALGHNSVFAQFARTPNFQSMKNDSNSIKVNYTRTVTPRCAVGTEYELTLPFAASALRFCYFYTFRQARVQGSIDTSGKISATLQEMHGLSFSGVIDYVEGLYKFGFALRLNPGPEGPEE